MANFERGVYEPSDEVRVFDGSEEEDDIEGSRLPLLIVLALLVLAMFAGVVWLAYTQGVARGRGETPVLTAAGGPERIAPQAAGNTVPYQGFKIYEQPAPSDDSADAAPAAPAPAAPAAAPKPAPMQAVAPAPPKPAPMQAVAPAPPKPAPMQTAMAPAAPSKPAPQPAPQPAPKAAALTPPAKPAPASTSAAPKSVAALIQQANSVPEPAKPAPATKRPAAPPPITKPATASAAAPAVGAATGAPRALVAAAKPALQAAAPIAALAGSYVLQIGAYKSQADADTAWKSYKAKHAALLSGHSDNVQQVDLGEKGTWYRLRIAGFSDREVASALCDRLKADGGVCILGK